MTLDGPRLQLASAQIDPMLQLASAPFATWMGVIRVLPGGAAQLLRSSGDEDRIDTAPEHADVVRRGLADAGAPIDPVSATWLPLRALYPVLAHLDAGDAFDVATRMPAPRAEFAAPDAPIVPLQLRAALLDGIAGFCGGVSAPAAAADS